MSGIPVRVLETGQSFPSLPAAIEELFCRRKTGWDYANFDAGRPISGLHIYPADEDPAVWFQPPPPPGQSQGRRTPVRCIDTGIIYPSMAAAARANRVTAAAIYEAIHHRTKSGGHQWEYASGTPTARHHQAPAALHTRQHRVH
ncbi:MAG: hypothetical protein ACO29V_03365 [Limnohabitans sp.]